LEDASTAGVHDTHRDALPRSITTEVKMAARNRSAEWHGNVESGSGTSTIGDRVFEGRYSYESRFAPREGTNPEQMIAVANAACFTMALSNVLITAGHVPDSLRTNACVRLRNIAGVRTLARIDLDTEGHLLDVDEQPFRSPADEAKQPLPGLARSLGSPRSS
jgi:osmotically inducible protein OsmC